MTAESSGQAIDQAAANPERRSGLPPEIGEHAAQVREVLPGVLHFPYFGSSIAFLTEAGVVLFDTGTEGAGKRVLTELRKHTDLPVHTIIYSHGHLDHVGGAGHFMAEAAERGRPAPRVIGQRRLVDRLRRYERMWPWIGFIGSFQWDRQNQPQTARDMHASAPPAFVYPDTIVDERLTIEVGGQRFDLRHGLGETDDVLWLWDEARSLVCSGDLIIHSSPNVGNPWKVQRYTLEWAESLEAIAAMQPVILLPGHGKRLTSREEVAEVTLTTARYLRSIHDQVVERMNQGQWLEQIWQEVRPPAELAALPWLQPIYGHPQFIVQGVWRQYGGWYDGDPANFFPAGIDSQAEEITALAGADALLDRARALQVQGNLPLACNLVNLVRRAEPNNTAALRLWRTLFSARAESEVNMMARNTYRAAARDAEVRLTALEGNGEAP